VFLFLSAHSTHTTRESFLRDEVLMRAFVRSVKTIREAAKIIPEEARLQFPALEWKKMAGMWDRFIHGYGGVDYQIVWDVAASKAIPVSSSITAVVSRNAFMIISRGPSGFVWRFFRFVRECAGRSGAEEQPNQPAWFTNEAYHYGL